jgi:DNA-binding NarL/FixJ family response regulator
LFIFRSTVAVAPSAGRSERAKLLVPTTILIVDDHDLMRGVLRKWLGARFPGCDVIEAASGEEAISLAQVSSPHIVVMDVDLPGMSGIQATARIKAMQPATPVVILSLHDDTMHRTHATQAGASAYVAKEKMASELQSTLAALLPFLKQTN